MVNPIHSVPMGLPVDLVNIELPQTMQPATTAVAPAGRGAGLAMSDDHQPAGDQHRSTPPEGNSLQRMLDQINDSMQAWSTGMRFDIDEDAERVVVSIVDSASGEVLRTVPTEAVLRVAKMITQLQGGGVDTQA